MGRHFKTPLKKRSRYARPLVLCFVASCFQRCQLRNGRRLGKNHFFNEPPVYGQKIVRKVIAAEVSARLGFVDHPSRPHQRIMDSGLPYGCSPGSHRYGRGNIPMTATSMPSSLSAIREQADSKFSSPTTPYPPGMCHLPGVLLYTAIIDGKKYFIVGEVWIWSFDNQFRRPRRHCPVGHVHARFRRPPPAIRLYFFKQTGECLYFLFGPLLLYGFIQGLSPPGYMSDTRAREG